MMKFWFEMTMKLCLIALIVFTKSSFCSELPPAETLTIGTAVSTNASPWSSEFIQDLLPSVERTALLYHLSYLCLGNFPNLEAVFRRRVVETQLLFASSNGVMIKGVSTSQKLVENLLQKVKTAVKENKPIQAVRYLEEAKAEIGHLIRDVEDMIKRYDQHNQNLAEYNSDVYQEKITTENNMERLQRELLEITDRLRQIDIEINQKNTELQAKSILVIISLHEAEKIHFIKTQLTHLYTAKSFLKQTESKIQSELQSQSSKHTSKLGVIFNNLNKVQICLYEIKKFWETMHNLLNHLKDQTFAGEQLIEYLDILKDEFLGSIETAGKYWTSFSQRWQNLQGIFNTESKDAYRFLESNPSALSKEAWKSEYNSVVEKLNKISPAQPTMAAFID